MKDHRVTVPSKSKNEGEWKRLVGEWLKIIGQYSANKEKEVPYWYGERALTGLLASAAWRTKNGWALEEFSARTERICQFLTPKEH